MPRYRLAPAITLLILLAFCCSPAAAALVATPAGDQRHIVLTESDNGRTIRVAPGTIISVQLKESEAEAWHFQGQGNFRLLDDVVLESYPAMHSYRIKINGPGDLTFVKSDSRTGRTMGTYLAHVVTAEKAGQAKSSNYPLSGLHFSLAGSLLPIKRI